MKVISIMSAALAAGLSVSAAPTLQKRGLSTNDINTLQLALYLEHLEFALYSGGFNAFNESTYEANGFPTGYRDNIGVIAGVCILTICQSFLLTDRSMRWSMLLPLPPFSARTVSVQCRHAPTAFHILRPRVL